MREFNCRDEVRLCCRCHVLLIAAALNVSWRESRSQLAAGACCPPKKLLQSWIFDVPSLPCQRGNCNPNFYINTQAIISFSQTVNNLLLNAKRFNASNCVKMRMSSGQSSWLQNGELLCFLWGMNWIYICYVEESRPPLWSSGQSSWLENVCFVSCEVRTEFIYVM
jgi:hypothetical protein